MPKKYPNELIIEVVDAVDAGMSAKDAARKYGVELNTIYGWTKKAGRPTVEEIRRHMEMGKVASKFGVRVGPDGKTTTFLKRSPPVNPPPAYKPDVPPKVESDRVARLEREVTLLKKLLNVYREMLGVDLGV